MIFAPGRVELLGNHTDYNEGHILSAAIDLGVSIEGHAAPDGDLAARFNSVDFPGEIVATPDALDSVPRDSWARYPAGVLQAFIEAGLPTGGFTAVFSSTLPPGAGLSSSAAIEVATAKFLLHAFGGHLSRIEVAKLCRHAENNFVGVNCGLLDQVSSVFGRQDHIVRLDCRTEEVTTLPVPPGLALLVTHSGVAHRLVGGEYNERREQCFAAARALGVPFLRDTDAAQLEAAAHRLPSLPLLRARHVVGENERVLRGAEFLRMGDSAAFGQLMFESHQSSIDNFSNSTPELDALVGIARGIPGVLGSRLTGGGFGGATVSLVEEDKAGAIAAALVDGYAARTGHTARTWHCRFADGALPEEG